MNVLLNRLFKVSAIAVLVGMLAAGGARLFAADPPNPLAQGGKNAAPAAQGSLTIQQIGDAVSNYNKNTNTDNGQTVYSITVPKGKWNLNILVSLSPDGSVIWMTNGLSGMPDANKVNTNALLDLLKKNSAIGPMFFSIYGDSLRMNYPVTNANLTADGLKEKIEAMATTVADTASLWSPDALMGNAGAGAANPLAK